MAAAMTICFALPTYYLVLPGGNFAVLYLTSLISLVDGIGAALGLRSKALVYSVLKCLCKHSLHSALLRRVSALANCLPAAGCAHEIDLETQVDVQDLVSSLLTCCRTFLGGAASHWQYQNFELYMGVARQTAQGICASYPRFHKTSCESKRLTALLVACSFRIRHCSHFPQHGHCQCHLAHCSHR